MQKSLGTSALVYIETFNKCFNKFLSTFFSQNILLFSNVEILNKNLC